MTEGEGRTGLRIPSGAYVSHSLNSLKGDYIGFRV